MRWILFTLNIQQIGNILFVVDTQRVIDLLSTNKEMGVREWKVRSQHRIRSQITLFLACHTSLQFCIGIFSLKLHLHSWESGWLAWKTQYMDTSTRVSVQRGQWAVCSVLYPNSKGWFFLVNASCSMRGTSPKVRRWLLQANLCVCNIRPRLGFMINILCYP